jgi:hypothetical protein
MEFGKDVECTFFDKSNTYSREQYLVARRDFSVGASELGGAIRRETRNLRESEYMHDQWRVRYQSEE